MTAEAASNNREGRVIRCVRVIYLCTFLAVLVWGVRSADAGTFLPHGKGLTNQEKVAYFRRSIRHERQVVEWLESKDAPRTLQRVSELGWYRAALAWHERLLVRYSAKLRPPPPPPADALRAYAGPCLAAIIDSEDQNWSPTQYNVQGSGAYGLPQALPGSKMASAGPDWATNPYTQIRWAHQYAVERYGGDCGAWAHWQAARSW